MSPMTRKPHKPPDLRDAAEAKLAHLPAAPSTLGADGNLHELQVHKIELEMQNESLRQAQVALEYSRIRYVNLYEFAPVGYLTLTRRGLIAGINIAACRHLGRERGQLLNTRFGLLVSLQDRTRWQDLFEDLMRKAGGESGSCELLLQHDDGSPLQTHVDCLRVDTGDDAPALNIAFTDITARMQAESALRESEANYRALFDNNLDGVLLTTLDGDILAANPAAQHIFGRTEQELRAVGRKGVVDLTDPRLAAAIAERSQTGRFRGELSFIRKDGTPFPVEVSSRVFEARDGRQLTTMVVRDLGEQKQAEEARLASEARFAGVFQTSLIGIGISRISDGCFVDVNDAFLRLFGYAREEVIGRTSAQLGMWVHLDQRDRMMRILKAGEALKEFEAGFRRKSGETGVLLISARFATLRGEDYLIGQLSDITERKRIETELRDSNERLHVSLSAAPLTVFHQDRELRYTWIANPSIGLEPERILGCRDEDLFDAQDAAELTTIKRRVLASGVGERREVRMTVAGEQRCYDMKVEPHLNAAGQRIGLLCASLNITTGCRLRQERDAAYYALQRLGDRVQDEIEAERRGIARDIHDQVGASLTAINLKIDALTKSLATGQGQGRAMEIKSLLTEAMVSTRELCTRLRPPILDDLGLVETCRWYLDDWSRKSGIRGSGRFSVIAPEPDDMLRTDLFRILQELLTNVARHSGATRVGVSLSGSRGLRLRVRDNGEGFQTGERNGLGLTGIRERLRRHGGKLAIDDSTTGATITVSVPPAKARP